ncbi:hypothetical protein M3Y99_01898600 [Aphelenchoides fujianensis]|nr:hypothetical protein M3Y99_01898600 [Aphelenchoides fujianensis]
MFAGKVAIVTGSTSGIGQATALLMAKRGARAVIHGQSKERLQNTLQLFAQNGVKEDQLHVVMGPITEESVQRKLIDETVQKFGRLDVLVNNAGTLSKPGLNQLDVRNLDFIFNVNFRSIFTLTQLAAPHLAKQKGAIVNVSSVSSTIPVPEFCSYALCKAALDHFTRISALMYAPDVRVNSVNPGFVKSLIATGVGLREADAFEAAFRPICESHVPQRRMGKASEVAEIIALLASKQTAWVTGSMYTVDGGIEAGPALPKEKPKKPVAN